MKLKKDRISKPNEIECFFDSVTGREIGIKIDAAIERLEALDKIYTDDDNLTSAI